MSHEVFKAAVIGRIHPKPPGLAWPCSHCRKCQIQMILPREMDHAEHPKEPQICHLGFLLLEKVSKDSEQSRDGISQHAKGKSRCQLLLRGRMEVETASQGP